MDYYPFGWEMPGRKYNSAEYRYGFNGKEKDQDGEFGSITNYDYGFRIYNPAIGRFLSVDPLTKEYPMFTPYQFAANSPIWGVDLDGLELDITSNSPVKTRILMQIADEASLDAAIMVAQSQVGSPWPDEDDYVNLMKDSDRLLNIDGSYVDPYPSITNNIATASPNGTETTITLYGTIWKDGKWGGDLERVVIGSVNNPKAKEGIGKPYGPPELLVTIVDPIKKAGQLVEDIGNNPGILAFELGAQVSIRNITFGRSAYFASDGTSFGSNIGPELTTDKSFSFSINFNALVAKDRKTSLVGMDFSGLEDNFSVDVPTPYKFSVGANIINGAAYSGVGLSITPNGTAGAAVAETFTRMDKDTGKEIKP